MNQDALELNSNPDQWRITLSNDWDVLGPFPIHAREQHFISPGFPLNLTSPYHHEPERMWPSSLSENAAVTWTKARSDVKGSLAITFPDIRWSKVRATEGWAALQHHAVLRTTLTVQPPRSASPGRPQPRICVELVQGSFFTILPRDSPTLHPEWHSGNIYSMHRAAHNAVELPGIVHVDKPTILDFFVSGDYEIRLFGDSRDSGEEMPTLRVNITVSVEEKRGTVVRQDSHDVVCDFVDGFAFGDALGIGLRSVDGWWVVEDIELPEKLPTNVSLDVLYNQRIAPSQTRVIPISITQTEAYNEKTISFNLVLSERRGDSSDEKLRNVSVPITIALRHLILWDSSNWEPIRATFFFASSHPTYLLAKPPKSPSSDGHSAPILALHGAGVDIISAPFWAYAIPRQKYSWIVMPTGRTEWGLDWHGASASEAWATLPALSNILHRQTEWKSWAFSPESRAVIAGHSNGGQGAWYLASRFPDRTLAALPAAGYLSPAAYVPLMQARGARFADPALRSVLESSYVPDDNALFLGNLADHVPVLAVHGGDDTNVPTWHSREYVSIIKSWGTGLNVSFHGDEGQPHWYPNVFESAQVQTFLEEALNSDSQSRLSLKDVSQFTLTVADPIHSGSLHGWTVDALIVPGRLARLHVELRDGSTHVRTTNVLRFSVPPESAWISDFIVIDGARPSKAIQEIRKHTFTVSESGTWHRGVSTTFSSSLPAPPGRVQNTFDTPGPMAIIVPSDSHTYLSMFFVALRIAHALDVFLKIDCDIVLDTDACRLLERGSEKEIESMRHCFQGNLIVLGGRENEFSRKLLQVPLHSRQTEFGISESGQWLFRDRVVPDGDGDIGILTTHPHPINPSGSAFILSGVSKVNKSSSEGLERVLRLIMPRTGIAVPDWIIVGSATDYLGAGGVIGAGVWGSSWKWSESMSYMS